MLIYYDYNDSCRYKDSKLGSTTEKTPKPMAKIGKDPMLNMILTTL